jgi:DNA-binding response OmpR family regulator
MLSLLIVDDDMDLAEALADVITALGHTVQVTHSGGEGMSTLRKGRFDVILLDLKLPDGHGTMWLEQMVKEAPETRKLIMTGFVDEGVEERCRALGADHLLLKPFSMRELIEQLVDDA